MKCRKCDNESRASGLCSKCYGAEWYAKNKEKVRKRKEKWYVENRDIAICKAKQWKKINPEKSKLIDANRDRAKLAAYYKNRYHSDIDYRLKVIVRNRLKTALRCNFKNGKTLELLGCSIEHYRKYIEARWTDGMSWDNHTLEGWHIDHIVPLESFDLSDPEQLKKASHYTNTRPLWWDENLKRRYEL